jgi:hypothetical protein
MPQTVTGFPPHYAVMSAGQQDISDETTVVDTKTRMSDIFGNDT